MTTFEGFQLSPQQRRLWRLQRTSGAYTARCALEIRGPLEPERLAAALSEIVARHEILRTTFPVPPALDTPLQVIADQAEPVWETGAEEEPFDAARGPLLRVRLARLDGDRHAVTLTLPALCADARSLLNLCDEWGRAYAGEDLPDDPMQYADYAAWLDEQMEAPESEVARAHWRSRGLDSLGDARLPLERLPVAVFTPEIHGQVWPAARGEEIQDAARRAGASPAAWLLACWQTLLGRLAGEAPAAIGVLADGRELEALLDPLGLYARYVPVTGSGATFAELARALDRALAEAREWQDAFSWDDVAPGREGSFPFGFDYTELPPARRVGDVEMQVTRLEVCLDRFKVWLSCQASTEGLRAELAYDPSCLDAGAIARLAGQLDTLVEGALRAPDAPLGELPLLGADARHQILSGFNHTAPLPDWTVPVHEQIRRQAAATPLEVALDFNSGDGRTLTYAELDRQTAALAGRLRALGVGPEVVVGLFLERSPEMVIGLLAVLAAGGAYLPLDPEHPRERLAFMLEDSGAALVLTDRRLAARLPEEAPRVVLLESLAERTAALPAGTLPEQLAYVIYTSGSTGRPKGTSISHRALANYLDWAVEAYTGAPGGAPLHSPLAFDLTVTGLFVPLLTGRPVTLVPESQGIDGLAEALRRGEHGFAKLTPAHMEVLRQQLGDAVSGIRCGALVLGGEALLASHVDWWRQRSPATRMINEYGPTEATVGCCVHELSWDATSPEALPIGRPIPGLRLHVVDARLEPVPVGVTGELVIGGAGLARGYLGRPELTAERFVPDPHATAPGERLYRTGDLARYLPSGDLEFLGRRDSQVKLHGYRIELGEIEAVLRQHPAVRDAVVLLDEENPGHPRLCACWVGETATGDLAAWLEHRLPAYMVPHVYVGIEALPLTVNGKVDRAALREIVRRRSAAERRAYREPRTHAERVLAEVWSELLGAGRVGLDDDFFRLGGDSILSLQVIGRAGRHGLRLTARQIFDHPTLGSLAAIAATSEPVAAEEGPVSGPVPLTPIQEAFFATPSPARHHYNLALALAPRRALETAHLARAVAALWRHHDALRLRFHEEDGVWTQENAGPEAPVPFAVIDLTALPAADRDAARSSAAAQLAAGFDLAAGPLARWILVRAGAGADRLLVLLHHLVADVVSLRVLVEDLETACRAADLPARGTSFRRWAERLREQAASPGLRAELDVWLASRRRQAVPLPLDGRPLHRTVAESATHRIELDEGSTLALLRETPRAYRTEINDVLLAALGLVLTRWSGGPVVVDLEGHGREELFADLDVTRTVGWFTTLYPVLLDPPAAGPREVLIAAKEELRRLPFHGIGYGLLRHLCPDPAVRQALAAMPTAQVAFNYLGQMDAGGGPAARTETLFAMAGEAGGAAQSPLNRRPYLLEVNAFVAGGRLRVEWRYDREAHRSATIEALAGRFLDELRGLIEHCRSRPAAALTPSDVPLAGLDQARLDGLSAAHGEIADLYPLAPIQEGMLLHSLSFPGSDVGFEQTALRLRGPIDPAALRGAARRLVERHPVLRTCFAWQGLDRSLQAILPPNEPAWAEVDLRALPPSRAAEAERELLAADRRRGFDLERTPPVRLTLARLSDGEAHLIWSRHHLLLDGWSTAIVLGELETAYRALRQGEEPRLPHSRPYRDYIAWLAGQDPARTEEYWRRLLAGFATPTPIAVERLGGGRPPSAPRWAGRRRGLPAALDRELRELAAQRGLTLNVLVQAAWACLLSRYAGEADVLFGTTVSGRPADLPGVETMVGLFIKNLPVRLRCAPDRPVTELLRGLQSDLLEMREHEAASPADVQPWSEVPGSLPLFESLVVFENYPVANPAVEGWDDGVPEDESAAAVRTAYPLTLVAAQARTLVLLLVYDGDRFEDTAVQRMLGHLETLLAGITREGGTVSALPILSAAERHQLLVEWGPEPAITDEEGRPVPLGVVGEIPGTGELARHRLDGSVVRLGRRDRQVRLQGRRVDLGRLEETLAGHPAVSAAAAVVRPPGRLLAYVETAGAAVPDAGELRAFLRQRWSGAPQPADVVALPALPRLPGGAVDREALPDPEAARLTAEISSELLGSGPDLVAAQLARIWEDVLGTRPVGLDDDFFALGGSSVAALRLASRVRQELGRDLPLAALYRAATVRGLAAELSGASAAWSPLVAIRPGGDLPPFFCVHPVGGNVLCFVDLARRLDPRRPFYGLQAAGLGGGREPFHRLDDMAACYLEEIRRVQPAGPYLLGGLSFGGTVAFEMARRLVAAGEEVALLAILDTGSPLYHGRQTFQTDAAGVLAIQAGIIARAGGASLALDAAELRRLDPAARLDFAVARLAAAGGATLRGLGAEHLRRVLALYQAHARCLETYLPEPYPGRITVFRARDEHRALEAILEHPAQHEPDYGWGGLSPLPVEVRVVPGDHSTMMYEPRVAGLAAELDAALAGKATPAGLAPVRAPEPVTPLSPGLHG